MKEVRFVYRPPNSPDSPVAQSATLGVKFSKAVRILDPWYIFGGTRWSRTLFRLKHPVVYSKRGLRKLYYRFKRLFIKPRMIQPLVNHPWEKHD